MPKFPDTPKRTTPSRADLRAIYRRQFGASPDGLTVTDLKVQIARLGRCECSCKRPLQGLVEYDHSIALALQFEGDPPDFVALRPECHRVKTGQDVAAIAKAKRRAGLSGQYARRKKRGGSSIKNNSQWSTGRKLQSRGFNKRLRKKMDGTVEVRDASS